MFRLALALGRTVAELQQTLSAAELVEWMAFYRIDPWGGYRAGFSGTTSFKLKDFDINKDLGPASQEVELTLSVEGVRQ